MNKAEKPKRRLYPALVWERAKELGRHPDKWRKDEWRDLAIALAWRLRPGLIWNAMHSPPEPRRGRPKLLDDAEAVSYYRAVMSRYKKGNYRNLYEFFDSLRRKLYGRRPHRDWVRSDVEQLRNIGRALRRKGLI